MAPARQSFGCAARWRQRPNSITEVSQPNGVKVVLKSLLNLLVGEQGSLLFPKIEFFIKGDI